MKNFRVLYLAAVLLVSMISCRKNTNSNTYQIVGSIADRPISWLNGQQGVIDYARVDSQETWNDTTYLKYTTVFEKGNESIQIEFFIIAPDNTLGYTPFFDDFVYDYIVPNIQDSMYRNTGVVVTYTDSSGLVYSTGNVLQGGDPMTLNRAGTNGEDVKGDGIDTYNIGGDFNCWLATDQSQTQLIHMSDISFFALFGKQE